ncbi:MAG: hypothetical protein HY815_03790 [Candidatus Riflebacteria bacterium]|nr:hypothetical protein [Candidatus Riflebacteria bacterium]
MLSRPESHGVEGSVGTANGCQVRGPLSALPADLPAARERQGPAPGRSKSTRNLLALGLSILLLTASNAVAQPETGIYIGTSRCTGAGCHGSAIPDSGGRIAHDEFQIWAQKDKHAQAWAVLELPLAEQIVRRLGPGWLPASREKRCLACHDLSPPKERQDKEFAPVRGVSCEACHGPAKAWLEVHSAKDQHQKSLKAGLYDLQNPVKCVERCLTCHLGTRGGFDHEVIPERIVDHTLIAAGHPDLTFEFELFARNMPPHWKSAAPQQAGDGLRQGRSRLPRWWGPFDRFQEIRIWAIGQAVQLRENLRRIAFRARTKPWPEYAELDCAACHHSLTTAFYSSLPTDSWRQKEGYAGRNPGSAPLNLSPFAVYRKLLAVIAPDGAKTLVAAVSSLERTMSAVGASKEEAAELAERAAGLADGLIAKVSGATYDDNVANRVLLAIAADGGSIALMGHRAAIQAAWALDLLVSVGVKSRRISKDRGRESKAILDRMFRQLESVSDYDASKFRDLMAQLDACLK